MQLKAYSIFDNKALIYHPPFFAHTDGEAVRHLSDLANDLNTQIGRHPADFVLYCIGVYDNQKGQLTPVLPLLHVYDAIGLVKLTPQLPLDASQPNQQVPVQRGNGSLPRSDET